MKHVPALFTTLCALVVIAGCNFGTNADQPALPTPTAVPAEGVVPTAVPTSEKLALPAPVPTGEAGYVPPPPLPTPPPTPKPPWDLHSLVFNASVVADARIIGSEKRPGSYTFIFYVDEWYKNEPGVKDNIVRLTLDTTRNWDKLVYLPRNLIGGDAGSDPFSFMLFLGGTPDTYSIVGDTAGVFYMGDRVETSAGAEEYQNMPVESFKKELIAALPATPTPLPPSPTPRPTPANGSPVSLLKVGDGYQVYVHRGIVRIGVGGMPTWVGASQLQVSWSSGKEPYEGASYAVDVQAGTLEKYIYPQPEWAGKASYGGTPNRDGKSALLLKGATEDIWGVTYYDMATKQEQTVYDRNPAVAQWAGADAHEPGIALSPGTPIWLNEETFVLPLGSSPATGEPRGRGKLLMVSASSHKVRLLAKVEGETDGEISYSSARYGMPLVYQDGTRSGPLLMLRAPYTGRPITLTAGGPWIRDWAATPDGSRVAWVEAMAPPGDWSERLPLPCVPCQDPGPRDPEPQVQAIAIWDAATGQVYRYKPSNLVWSLGSAYFMQQASLNWRADGSALIYATHSSPGAPGRTALYSLRPGNQPELLAEHPWDGSIRVLSEGGEGSLYYYVTGRSYYASGDLVRRHPDGRLDVLHKNLISNMWWMEPGKWLEVLQEGGVAVHDFVTGNTRYARFPGELPSPGQLGWGGVQNLVPLSPDGEWAAYAGTNSDMGVIRPEGKPDRGQAVQIVRVK